jgi:hypothetical protein
MTTPRAFSILLFMADTLNNNAYLELHEPADPIPAPGYYTDGNAPFILRGLNLYIVDAFERAQR